MKTLNKNSYYLGRRSETLETPVEKMTNAEGLEKKNRREHFV